MILVSHLVVDMSLEELNEFKRITHNMSLALSGFLLALSHLLTGFWVFKFVQGDYLNRLMEAFVKCIANHLAAERAALIGWQMEEVRAQH